MLTGAHANTELTAATQFFWYEAVQVRYTVTDNSERSGQCTFSVEVACTIEKWARGTDFTEASSCGQTSGGDQMSCLTQQVVSGTPVADGFVELSLEALQTAASGAVSQPQPRTLSMPATMDGGVGTLGFDMFWKPQNLVRELFGDACCEVIVQVTAPLALLCPAGHVH